ncbi:MAG: hypothetical protein Q4G07_11420 [Oscillospiraceae bacterium]|nr:hypothetical protein [Oscillospiraceae bacterium]
MRCPCCNTDMRCTGLTFTENGAVQRYECRNRNCAKGSAGTAREITGGEKREEETDE